MSGIKEKKKQVRLMNNRSRAREIVIIEPGKYRKYERNHKFSKKVY